MKHFYDVAAWHKKFLYAVTCFSFIGVSNQLCSQELLPNLPPTLSEIVNQTVKSNGDGHFVRITGISPGQNENQSVRLSVESNRDLFEKLEIHEGGNGSAFVQYLPKTGVNGIATITVTAIDDAVQPSSARKSFNIIIEGLGKAPAPDLKLPASSNGFLLKAYPNPTSTASRISFSSKKAQSDVSLDLYAVNGVKVENLFRGKTSAQREYNINLLRKKLPAGTYFVKLIAAGEMKTLQVIVK